jgi:hypothetical protein
MSKFTVLAVKKLLANMPDDTLLEVDGIVIDGSTYTPELVVRIPYQVKLDL